MKSPPKVNDEDLKLYYGRVDRSKYSTPDICVCWGKDCSKADGCLLQYIVLHQKINNGEGGFFPTKKDLDSRKTLKQELEDRGYDISTLKISIKKKKI